MLGLEVVLPDGEVVQLGGDADGAGYDLAGVFVGSEGTLGIATKVGVRLVPRPEAVETLLAAFDVDRRRRRGRLGDHRRRASCPRRSR